MVRMQVALPTVAAPTVRPLPPAGMSVRLMHNLPALVIVTATKVIVTANPSGVVATTPFSMTVNATNVSNVVAAGYTGSATVTKASGPGTLSGTTTASFSAGVLTFSNLILSAAGTYTLTISSGSLTPATTASFTVSALAFAPDQLANLIAWFDAATGAYVDAGSTLATNGQTVQQWTNRADGAHPASQATGANRPTFQVVSGVKSLSFTGDRAIAASGLTGASGTATVFVVVASTSTGGQFLYSLHGTGGGNDIVSNGGLWQANINGGQWGQAFPDGALHVFTAKFDSTAGQGATLYKGRRRARERLNTAAGAMATTAFTTLSIGSDVGISAPMTGTIYEVVGYARVLSDSECQQVQAYLTTKWSTPALSVSYSANIAFVGDSLTAGYVTNYPYPNQMQNLCTNDTAIINYAFTGAQTNDVVSDQIPLATAAGQTVGGIRNIAVLWVGTNDLANGVSAATAYSNLVSARNSLQGAGWETWVINCIARNAGGSQTAFDSARTTYNASIAGGAGWDGKIDLAADSRFSTFSDTTYYYSDGVHMKDSSNGIIAGIVKTALGLT